MRRRAAMRRGAALRAVLWPAYAAVVAVVLMRWADLSWTHSLLAGCAALVGGFVVDLAIRTVRATRNTSAAE